MALPKSEVDKAFYLFKQISNEGDDRDKKVSGSFIQEFDKENPFDTRYVFGEDHKADDGWECVFINVENINPVQLELWYDGKSKIYNSSFMQAHPGNITRIGFF